MINKIDTSIGWYIIPLLILMIGGISISGCLEEIALPLPREVQDGIVLEGRLQDGDPAIASVTISRIFDFTSNSSKPVNVREVTILNDAGQSLPLEEISLGYYEIRIQKGDDRFSVDLGMTFQLRVVTFDGEELLSRPEPLISVAEAGPITVATVEKKVEDRLGKFVNEDYFAFLIDVPVESSSDGEAGRFLWSFEEAWKLTDTPILPMIDPKTCYITESANVSGIVAFDGNTVDGVSSISIPLYERRINYQFAEGFYLIVYQQSLSAGALKYWEEVGQVVQRTGNMFEAPAGMIRSNFDKVVDNGEGNQIFGYFYVTQVDTSYKYVDPSLADFPTALCPWPPGTMSPPGRECPLVPCCDCLVADRSQVEKPAFWIE